MTENLAHETDVGWERTDLSVGKVLKRIESLGPPVDPRNSRSSRLLAKVLLSFKVEGL